MLFAAHVVGIFALHTREPIMTRVESTRGRPAADPAPSVAPELDGLNDPLIFAGAHPRGFSAHAWLDRPRMDYAQTNRPVAPRFLAYARPAEQQKTELAAPRLSTPLPFLPLSLQAPPARSALMVEGALAERPLLETPALSAQFATDVLSNSVVQLGIQGDGFPISARIISGSGRREADLSALQIANGLRFAPRPGTSVQWGQLVFQWFTAEPTGTNLPAK